MERLTEVRLQSHIDECKHRIDNINNFVSNNSDADKEECAKNIAVLINVINVLEEYKDNKDAEEQGLLLRLPVKAGDTVYAIRYGEENDFVVVETKIIEIRQNINGTFFEPLISRKAYKVDDFGKEVFLTQAEAEQKLKEMEGE